jgi:hypothetical protein
VLSSLSWLLAGRRKVATDADLAALRSEIALLSRRLAQREDTAARQEAVLRDGMQALADRLDAVLPEARFAAALRPYAGVRLPLYLDEAGAPAAVPARGAAPRPVLVLSLPKAGTYLVAALLGELGLADTGLHLAEAGLTDYRHATREEAVSAYVARMVALPIAASARLVHPGQFAVGHMAPTPEVLAATEGFARVLLLRDLRDCLVSAMRFLGQAGRGVLAGDLSWRAVAEPRARMLAFLRTTGADFLRHQYAPMTEWLGRPGIPALRFEALLGDAGEAGRRAALETLVAAAFLPHPPEAGAAALARVLGRPTLTFSGRRSRLEEVWSDAAEDAFAALGGPALNARLGYAAEAPQRRPSSSSSPAAPGQSHMARSAAMPARSAMAAGTAERSSVPVETSSEAP